MFFIDSVTTPRTVGQSLAREMGVKTGRRDVFLDNEQNSAYIRGQLAQAVRMAKKKGYAIVICHAAGMPGDVLLMCNNNDGVAFPPEFFKQRHDFLAGLGIEVACRFVGQQEGRFVDQGAGDGHALALAAGKFVGFVMNAVGQADLRQRVRSATWRRSSAGTPA